MTTPTTTHNLAFLVWDRPGPEVTMFRFNTPEERLAFTKGLKIALDLARAHGATDFRLFHDRDKAEHFVTTKQFDQIKENHS